MRTRLKLAGAAALLAFNIALLAGPRPASATMPTEKLLTGSCWNCYVTQETLGPCCVERCLAACSCSRAGQC